MKAIAIIPARYASTRLPGKMLLNETGKYLIQHVYEQVQKARTLSRIVIAVDDEQVAAAVRAFGGEAVMTSAHHQSGTDRIAEAMRHIGGDYDVIINVQGDEPEIEPDAIDQLAHLQFKSGAFMSTLSCPFPADKTEGTGSPADPNRVKIVLGDAVAEVPGARYAVYFTRALAPYPRDDNGAVVDASRFHLHLGVYAYTPQSIKAFTSWAPGLLEQTEKLEQLRAVEKGQRLAVGFVKAATAGIDVQADYDAFVARHRARS